MTTDRLVRVADATFRVRTRGRPGSGHPPIVLVHGIGISHRAFSRLAEVLAADDVVHVLDMPGFGDLPRPGHSPDVPAMAELLADVVAGLGDGPFAVVGNSMGTQWAIELACRHPGLVSRVVAIGPVVDERRRSAARQALALAHDCLRETVSANAIVLSDYVRCGPRWYFRQLPHMLAYRPEERVTALRRPLLIVRGERDPVARRAWCVRLRDAAQDGRLVEIAGQPHLVQHTAPRAVAAVLRPFLAADREPSRAGDAEGP
ncbi:MULTISPECIES: alpha/beta fold hydrolase [Microbacterium]|uniref:Alpha/beta hydrolase n=1 Tax=Microbacterium barkeri TaxID=33917 RepID=A0A9W6H1C9_9MICO|nr:alpha/beta hydrolase [Microbacterium barkeri]MDR6876126.1 pimeloyl-ACP methyl ester carboxylesterase [Microbacterium barkeri]GLJ60244.1 alpha/beta hydrolase [Microbacterium barkeri]